MTDTISGALDALYITLHALQKPDGSFASMSVHDDVHIPSPTIFSTAVVLSMLPANARKNAKDIAAHGVAYIQQQQKETGSWNYWQKHQSEKQQYPDDLDDTAVCFAALSIHAPDMVTGAMIARLAHILNACEHDEGGPYNTWITDWQYNTQFSDIDLAVNANIAFCLAHLGVQLPKLSELFTTSITEQDYYSEYYCSPVTMMYFIARAHAKKSQRTTAVTEQLVQHIAASDAFTNPDNAFETACAVSAFLLIASPETQTVYAKPLSRCITFLVTAVVLKQYTATPWYREQKTTEALWYCQSTAITVAACIEALTLYKATAQQEKSPSDTDRASHTAIEQFTQTIPSQYKQQIFTITNKSTSNTFAKEMIALPFHIAETLAVSFPKELLETLAVATTTGWVGYSIIDRIMDHQEDISLLPCALTCIRALQTIYAPYGHIAGVSENLQAIEGALSREYQHRLQPHSTGWIIPHNKQALSLPLYEKSLGVTLPIFILCATAAVPQETTVSLVHFFHHYLSVRQRTDDAHDIIEDLTAGRQTPLIALLLQRFQKKYPERTSIAIQEDAPALLAIFWRDCFPIIQQENNDNVLAMEALIASLQSYNATYLNSCVSNLIAQEQRIAKERRTIQSFLLAY